MQTSREIESAAESKLREAWKGNVLSVPRGLFTAPQLADHLALTRGELASLIRESGFLISYFDAEGAPLFEIREMESFRSALSRARQKVKIAIRQYLAA